AMASQRRGPLGVFDCTLKSPARFPERGCRGSSFLAAVPSSSSSSLLPSRRSRYSSSPTPDAPRPSTEPDLGQRDSKVSASALQPRRLDRPADREGTDLACAGKAHAAVVNPVGGANQMADIKHP